MRIILDVSTIDRTPDEVRANAVVELDRVIKKNIRHCAQCKAPFLSERRRRKLFCNTKCRWAATDKTKMKRYYAAKKKKKKRKKENGT